MDMITLAMAKAYSDSKGGYTAPGKVYTYDGNLGDKETYYGGGLLYARLCDVIDPYSITEIELLMAGNAKILTPDDFTVDESDEKATLIKYGGYKGVYIFKEGNSAGVSAGTYVLSVISTNTYVTRIVTAETIVPIDPKYLPPSSGGGLPAIEVVIATPTFGEMCGIVDETSVAKLNAMAEKDTVFLLTFDTGAGCSVTALMVKSAVVGEAVACGGVAALEGPMKVLLMRAEGAWMIYFDGMA